jgi:phage tail tape measure protein, TP901 family
MLKIQQKGGVSVAKNMELNIVMSAVAASALSGLAKVGNAMKTMSSNAKNLEKQMKELDKAQKSVEKVERLKSAYVNVSKEFLQATRKLRELKEAYEKTGRSNVQLAEKIKEQEKIVNNLNKQKERQKHLFEAARSAIEAEGHSLKQYKENLSKVSKELEKQQKLKEAQNRHTERMNNWGKVKSFGDKAFNAGVGTTAAMAVPVKIAIDLEEAQADLKKVAEFSSKEMEAGFYQAMRNFSESNPVSQTELFQIAGAGAQAGIQTHELTQYTKDAAKIKVAFDMDTEAAGNFLAKTRAQLNLDQKGVMEYADVINYLANTVAVTAPEVADISSKVAGLGGMAGISKEGVAALGASLVTVGVPSEVAATGLKNISLGLVAGESATKRQRVAFEKLGLSAVQVAKDMQIDGEGTMLKVFQKIKTLPKDVQAATLKDLFGKESIQSASELAKHIDEVEQSLKNVHDKSKTAGSVDKEYAQRIKTLKSHLDTLKNAFTNIGVDLGNALAPSLIRIATQLKPTIKSIADWIQKNPQLTQSILKTIGTIGLMSLGIGGAIKVFSPFFGVISNGIMIFDKFKAAGSFAEGFKTAFPVLSRIVGVFGKIRSFAVKSFLGIVKAVKFVGLAIKAAFLANPVAFIIVAIIAVIAILVVLYHKCAGFRNFVNAMWKAISTGAIAAWNWIKGAGITAWNAIKFGAIAIWSGITAAVRVGIAIIKAIFKGIVAVAKAVWNGIKTSAVNAWNVIKSGITAVQGVFTGAWNTIKSIALGVWDSIKSGFSGMIEGVKSILNGVVNFFTDKFNSIKEKAKNLPLIGGLFGKNYTGTNYWTGGLTTVAERGAEMIKIPGQSPFIAQSEMLMNLPKGTEILNASQTRNTLRERVNRIKERASNLGSGAQIVAGGDTINITINAGGNSNANDIAREVKRILAEMKNKKERVAFG